MVFFENLNGSIINSRIGDASYIEGQLAEIFGMVATGLLVAKPIQYVVNNKFGLNAKVLTETSLKQKPTHSEQFNNWEQMKEAHKGTVEKFVHENKPKGSPTLKQRFEKGGSVQIDTQENGTQIWQYIEVDIFKLLLKN